MDQQHADKYIQNSGLLDDFTEKNVKSFFELEFKRLESGQLSAKDFSILINTLLYQHLYDSELEIKESALMTSLQMATELNEVEPDSEDYNQIVNPIKDYLSSNGEFSS